MFLFGTSSEVDYGDINIFNIFTILMAVRAQRVKDQH